MALNLDPDSERLTLSIIRELALSLPGVVESRSYGTPAFRFKKKLLARMHDREEAIVVAIDLEERQALMEADPVTFYITPHYQDHPWVLVRLGTADYEELRRLLEKAWRSVAPENLVAQYDNA